MPGPRIKFMGEIVELDGKQYTIGNRHTKTGGLVLKEINQAAQDKLVDRIAKKMIKFVDREEIIKAALHQIHPKSLAKIDRKLRKKTPIKKRPGCIMLSVGDEDVLIQG